MKALFTLCLVFGAFGLFSQDFSDDFNQFKSKDQQDFEKAKQQQDSIFAKAIIDNWRAIHLTEPIERPVVPKPDEQPNIEDNLELEDLEHKFIDTQPRLMRSFSPPKLEYDQVYEPELVRQFSFYGEPVRVNYSSKFLLVNTLEVKDQYGFAKAWQVLSKLPYQSIIKELYLKKQELQLPDYGYLLLVEDFLLQLDISLQTREMCKWFLLVKSGYIARIGLIEGEPTLVLGSYGKIYGKRFYSSAGLNYYVMSDAKGKLDSYIADTDGEDNPFDLAVNQEIKLPLDPIGKKISYETKAGLPVDVEILYNQRVTDMLSKFPQAEIGYYLSSSSSNLLAKSVEKALNPLLEGLSDINRIQFLMEFVQKGFEYKSDSRQFGKEQVYFPEEMFSQEFSDCDDRVVLLAYLLRKFVDVPMVALGFPQHVALGLKLNGPVFGESVKYHGLDFTFCDPTYLNAPLGVVIPSADRSKMKVIEF